MSGADGGTGVGLIEVFEVGPASTAKLSNISTRGVVGSGDDVMIGGFIVGGTNPKTVLIRARGPTLSDFGVPGALADPLLRLFSGQTVIARNDNWQATEPLCIPPAAGCGGQAQIVATGLDPCQPTGFPGHPPTPTGCTRESAILLTLPAGAYTAVMSGADGGTGVGLIEVFEVAPAGPGPATAKFFPAEGSSGVQVVIEGSAFSPSSRVTFGGIDSVTQFVNPRQLVALVPFLQQGSSAEPLAAGPNALAVDGKNIGTFTVEPLPANPNPPGVVWDSFTAGLIGQLPTLLAALNARIDVLLLTATTPELIELLKAIKTALPEIANQIQRLSTIRPDLTPNEMALLERFLVREGIIASILQSQSAVTAITLDPTCTSGNVMDRALCQRKVDEAIAEHTKIGSLMCGGFAAIAFFVNPLVGGALSVICTAINLLNANDNLLRANERIGNVEIDGPNQLRSNEQKPYRANVTIEYRTKMDTVDVASVESAILVLKRFGVAVSPPIQFLIDVVRHVFDLDFPDLNNPFVKPTTGEVSGDNFDWKLNPALASVTVNQIGQVTTGNLPFEIPQILLSAKLRAEFLTRKDLKDEKKFTSECDFPRVGCKQIDLIPNITLAVQKVGTSIGVGTGTVTSKPPGINCGPVCSFDFPEGQVVTLTAQADPGSTFKGWAGACFGVEQTCTLKLEGDQTSGSRTLRVFASFEPSALQEAFEGEIDPGGLGIEGGRGRFDRDACQFVDLSNAKMTLHLSLPDQAGRVSGIGAVTVKFLERILVQLAPCPFLDMIGTVGTLNGRDGIFALSGTVQNLAFQESGTMRDINSQDSRGVTVRFSGTRVGDSIVGTINIDISGIGIFNAPITATPCAFCPFPLVSSLGEAAPSNTMGLK
jgi:hypothetical protein